MIPNATEENAGEYTLVVHFNGENSEPTTYNVEVNPLPEIDAGEDESIPYGTSTQLNGVILNGSASNHDVRWFPADKVDNNTILSPNTVNLEETVEYTLKVTHKTTGCESEDNKIVSVTGGALGTTIIADEQEICLGNEIQLTAQASGGSGDYTYSWTSEPEGFTSDIYNPYVEPSETTIYMVAVNDGYNTVNAEITITVNSLPEIDAGEDESIPYGTNTQLNGMILSGDISDYHVKWLPSDKVDNDTILSPNTINLEETVEYTLKVTHKTTGCENEDNKVVSVTGGALGATIMADEQEICIGGGGVQLTAQASGGSGDYTYSWTSEPEGFTSNIYNPYVEPSETTTYIVAINDGYNTVNAEIIITVHPLPEIDAGEDESIPYGTNTQLNGMILNGNPSDYHVRWSPADKVDNNTILSPNTINLEESVEYTLAVTQKVTGCSSEDSKVVTVTGGVLGTTIIADEQEICAGKRIQLKAQASGGSGVYTYSWISEPEGFTSDIYNPYIEPSETTTYIVTINDGYNTANASIIITVNPLPIAHAGEDFSIPYGTSTQLNASASSGTADYTYKWMDNPLLNANNIPNPTTKNIYDPVEFELEVTDSKGCKSLMEKVFVSLTGATLFTIIDANPPQVCLGDTCVLSALPSGGSENYTYTWKKGDDVIGQSKDVMVNPTQTTEYTLIVDDGYNTVDTEVKVVVNPLPYINLIPEDATILATDTIEACVNDTILLRATQPDPSSYYWGNATIDSVKKAYSSGLTFSMQTYSVEVINSQGCENNAQITIVFNYSACDNIIEMESRDFSLYPVPTRDHLHVKLQDVFKNDISLKIHDIEGDLIYQSTYHKEAYKNTAIKINLQSFAKGVYLITISDGTVKASKKIIIQ